MHISIRDRIRNNFFTWQRRRTLPRHTQRQLNKLFEKKPIDRLLTVDVALGVGAVVPE